MSEQDTDEQDQHEAQQSEQPEQSEEPKDNDAEKDSDGSGGDGSGDPADSEEVPEDADVSASGVVVEGYETQNNPREETKALLEAESPDDVDDDLIKEIEEERDRRLDPENRPDNVEVDNTKRVFVPAEAKFEDSDIDQDPSLGQDGLAPVGGDAGQGGETSDSDDSGNSDDSENSGDSGDSGDTEHAEPEGESGDPKDDTDTKTSGSPDPTDSSDDNDEEGATASSSGGKHKA